MSFYSESDHQAEKVNDEEYKESDYPTRHRTENKAEGNGYKQWFKGIKNRIADHEETVEEPSPSRFRASKKKKKEKVFWTKLIFKMIVIVAVYFNFKFILNYENEPIFTFYHSLYVLGICVSINFIAIWILFYKRSMVRLYLSILAILGSLGYYIYVNYVHQSFLGNNIIPSVLVIISILIAIAPTVNYYVKSFFFLLVPIIGIYFSGNQFALVWTLLFNTGLILLFRLSKAKKYKAKKKEERTRRTRSQSA